MRCPNCDIGLTKRGEVYRCSRCGFFDMPSKREVTELYAWIHKTPDGEGIVALRNLPVVFSDPKLISLYEPIMKKLAKNQKVTVELRKFSKMETITKYRKGDE